MKRSPIRVLSLILCMVLLCNCIPTALAASSLSGARAAESETDFAVPNAGTQQNAYTEILSETRTSFTTVKLQPGETIYYHIYGAEGKTLTVEDAAANLVMDGKTYTPVDGILTAAVPENAASPLTVQIANTGKAAAVFTVDAVEPEQPTEPTEPSEPTEPEAGSSAEYPIYLSFIGQPVNLQAVPADGTLYYAVYNIAGYTVKIDAPAGVSAIVGGQTYAPVDGVITIDVPAGNPREAIPVQLVNSGAADAQCVLRVDIPAGSAENPAELILGENTGTPIANDWGEYEYYYDTYTVATDGTITFALTSDATDFTLTVNHVDANDVLKSYDNSTDGKISVDVAEGDTLSVMFVLYDSMGGDFTLDVTFAVKQPEPGTSAEYPIYLSYNAAPVELQPIPANGTLYYAIYNIAGYTAKITAPAGVSAIVDGQTYASEDGVITIPVPMGNPRMPIAIQFVNDGDKDATCVLGIDVPAGTIGNPAELVLGDNKGTTVAGDYDGYNFVYTAEASGKLSIAITEGAEDYDLIVRNETAMVELMNVDFPDNVIVMDVTVGDEITVMFVPYEGYDVPACDFTLNAKLEAEAPKIVELTFNRPGAPLAAGTIPAGATVQYQIMGNMPAMIMTVQNAAGIEITCNGEVYTADDGVITMPISGSFYAPAELSVKNTNGTAVTLEFVINFPLGNPNNPVQLVLGDNKGTTVADDPDGYNFVYTAEASGKLSIAITEGAADYDLIVRNETAMVELMNVDFPDNVVVMDVTAGDEISIMFVPYDGWDIPACDFVLNAMLQLSDAYEVIFTEPGAPIATETIANGTSVVYNVVGNMPNMIMTAENADGFTIAFGGEVYKPVDGVITMPISGSRFAPAQIVITNNSGKAAALNLVINFPVGNTYNPAEMELGNNEGKTIADDPDGYNYIYTAEKAGKLYFEITEGTEDYDLIVRNETAMVELMNVDFPDNVVVMDVTAGDEISIMFVPYDGWDIPACDFVLNAMLQLSDAYEVIFTEPGAPIATETIANGTSVVYNVVGNMPNMIMTAENADGFTIAFGGEVYKPVDGVITMPISGSRFAPAQIVITNNSGKAAALNLVINFPVGNTYNPAEMELGNNEGKTIADDPDGYNYIYTAEKAGKLYFEITEGTEDYDLIVTNVTAEIELMSVDFEDGVVVMDVAKDDEIRVMFVPYDGWDIPACEFVLNATLLLPDPVEIRFAGPGTPLSTGTIPVGTAAVYRIMGNMPSMELKAENAADFEITYNGARYKAENGVIAFPVSGSGFAPAELTVANKGDKDASLNLIISFPEGNANNPAALALGENKGTTVADDPDGYNFAYTVTADGKLTIQITEGAADYDLIVRNETAMVELMNVDFPDNVIVMDVAAGDEIRIMFVPYDGWDIPACDFVLRAEFLIP